MNDYKTLCVISEWIESELLEAQKVSDQTHTVNRHVITFLRRKLREIDNHIHTYLGVSRKKNCFRTNHFYT